MQLHVGPNLNNENQIYIRAVAGQLHLSKALMFQNFTLTEK